MAAIDDLVTLRAPEVRTFTGFEIRELDTTESGSMIEGLAVPFDVETDVGWFVESFRNGAFTKTIRETKSLPLLLWHDNQTFPVGSAEKWTEVDGDGLRGVWRMDTKDELAVESVRKVRDGFLTGLSVGFSPIQQETMMDDLDIFHIVRTEVRLHEVSLTPTPAYAGAQVSLVRSRVQHGGKPRRSAKLDGWRNYLKEING